MTRRLKSFVVRTDSHGSDGEPASRVVNGEHLDAVQMHMHLFEARINLSLIILRDIEDGRHALHQHPLAKAHRILGGRYADSCRLMNSLGIFNNKWDYRSDWRIDDDCDVFEETNG